MSILSILAWLWGISHWWWRRGRRCWMSRCDWKVSWQVWCIKLVREALLTVRYSLRSIMRMWELSDRSPASHVSDCDLSFTQRVKQWLCCWAGRRVRENSEEACKIVTDRSRWRPTQRSTSDNINGLKFGIWIFCEASCRSCRPVNNGGGKSR